MLTLRSAPKRPTLIPHHASLLAALCAALLGWVTHAEAQRVLEFQTVQSFGTSPPIATNQTQEGDSVTAISTFDPEGQQVLASWVVAYDHQTPVTPVSISAAYDETTAPQAFPMRPCSSPLWGSAYCTGLNLPYGSYQLRSAHRVLLRRRLQNGLQLSMPAVAQSEPHPLIVDAHPSCFHFDYGQTSLQQFKATPYVYADDLSPVGCGRPIISRQASANFFPSDATRGGIATSLSCPLDLDDDPEEIVAFDYESPSLEARSDWQSLTALELRFSASFDAWVQPLLRVRKANGSEALYRETDANATPVFHPTGAKASHIVAKYSGIPSGAKILGVKIRVFMEHGALFSTQTATLDGICPLPKTALPDPFAEPYQSPVVIIDTDDGIYRPSMGH